jgi:hypothetical protein
MNDKATFTCTTDRIQAGSGAIMDITGTVTNSDEAWIVGRADPHGQINERDESDNVTTKWI